MAGYQRYGRGSEVANEPVGAAFVFGTVAALQDSPVNLAHLSTGISIPFGLSERSGRRSRTTCAGLELFGRLVVTNNRTGDVQVLAVRVGEEIQVGLAYLGEGPREALVGFEGPGLALLTFTGDGRTGPDGGGVDLSHLAAKISC